MQRSVQISNVRACTCTEVCDWFLDRKVHAEIIMSFSFWFLEGRHKKGIQHKRILNHL